MLPRLRRLWGRRSGCWRLRLRLCLLSLRLSLRVTRRRLPLPLLPLLRLTLRMPVTLRWWRGAARSWRRPVRRRRVMPRLWRRVRLSRRWMGRLQLSLLRSLLVTLLRGRLMLPRRPPRLLTVPQPLPNSQRLPLRVPRRMLRLRLLLRRFLRGWQLLPLRTLRMVSVMNCRAWCPRRGVMRRMLPVLLLLPLSRRRMLLLWCRTGSRMLLRL